jgi:hypothetical protein
MYHRTRSWIYISTAHTDMKAAVLEDPLEYGDLPVGRDL